MINVEFNDMK